MELDFTTLVLEVINFLVLVWLLTYFLYRPVQAAIARRREAIEADLSSARQNREQAEALQQQRQQQLKDWEAQQEQAQKQLQADLDRERKQRLQQLQTDLDNEARRLQSLAQHQQSEQERQLQQQALQLSSRFAARLLAGFSSPQLEQLILDKLLQDLQQLPEDQQQRLRESLQADGRAVRVHSAFPLPEAAQQQLRDTLLPYADGTDLPLHFDVDPELICGLEVAVDSLMLRANLKQELAFFAEVGDAA